MSKGYAASASAAIGHRGCEFGQNRKPFRLIDDIARLSRKIWPVCTAPELASRAAVSVRHAEYWLAGKSGMSGEALAELLASDAGLEILEGIMERRATKPDWWRAFRRRVRIENLEAKQRQLADELAELAAERSERRARR